MSNPYDTAGRLDELASTNSAKKAAVLAALSGCDMVVFNDVTVSILHGYLTLEGSVPTTGDGEKAVVIAEAVVGIGFVKNRLLCGRN